MLLAACRPTARFSRTLRSSKLDAHSRIIRFDPLLLRNDIDLWLGKRSAPSELENPEGIRPAWKDLGPGPSSSAAVERVFAALDRGVCGPPFPDSTEPASLEHADGPGTGAVAPDGWEPDDCGR